MTADFHDHETERFTAGMHTLDELMRRLEGRGPALTPECLAKISESVSRCPRCGGLAVARPVLVSAHYCIECDQCSDLAPSAVAEGIEATIETWELAVKNFDPEEKKRLAWLSDNRSAILEELVNAKREGRERRLPSDVIEWALDDPFIREEFMKEFEDANSRRARELWEMAMRGEATIDEYCDWIRDHP